MIFWHISKDIKERVLWLRANGYITDDICDMFGVSLQRFRRWQSTLHYLICDAGLTYKLLHKSASEQDEGAWEVFHTYMREHLVADQVVAADETSKDDWTIFCRWGRSPSGNQPTIDANFVHGECYSIVAAIKVDGYIGTCVVPGSVDGDEFFDFIVEDVVCFFLSHFPEPWHEMITFLSASSNEPLSSKKSVLMTHPWMRPKVHSNAKQNNQFNKSRQ
jgi:hypothetical protein